MKRAESGEAIGQRTTWQRKAIASALHAMARPVSAKNIHSSLCRSGKSINLSTVYRNLHALEQNNIVHRLVSGNDKKALYALHGKGCNTHFMICRICGKKQLTRWCPLENMQNVPDEDSFLIECHHLEIRGVCKRCRK
ncbi:MAG: Fur family transcriptional regulator [Chitinivibrionales bacterium]